MKCSICFSKEAIKRDENTALCPRCLQRELLSDEAAAHLQAIIQNDFSEWVAFYQKLGFTLSNELKTAAEIALDNLIEGKAA